ncbi:zinc-ribbon domain-containing protein [Ruegeria sp. HKCCD7255]|uniref:zinc-ribbon domain-containing protein n=1 Tax=Ruegeria sp. HKCCD7255 TaxID=2683004 RepID=UPI001487C06D|nr:zinc-ribbon domain-containing protein [Ruegeria sp. HKCCD7255]
MRITCPNCGAQYEVPDEVIPEGGRDVQCSNCEKTWFQGKSDEIEVPEAAEDTVVTPKPEPVPEPEAEPAASEATTDVPAEPEPVAEAKPETKKSSNLDPSISSILQEEAARESELRAKEGGSLESQPDFALDPPPVPAKVAPKRPPATQTASDAGKKKELPDVEAINSGLRSATVGDLNDAPPVARKSNGFLRGFALIVIIGVILLLIYSNANQISEAVPQADPVLQSYVSMVDQARLWLQAQSDAGAAQN